jgi:hypothetical protein
LQACDIAAIERRRQGFCEGGWIIKAGRGDQIETAGGNRGTSFRNQPGSYVPGDLFKLNGHFGRSRERHQIGAAVQRRQCQTGILATIEQGDTGGRRMFGADLCYDRHRIADAGASQNRPGKYQRDRLSIRQRRSCIVERLDGFAGQAGSSIWKFSMTLLASSVLHIL